jgi:tetratricopeptide (TPR) repeat protein
MSRHRTLLPALVLLCLAAAGCAGPRADRTTERMEQVLKSGVVSLEAGDYDGAVRRFDEGLALSPNHPSFLANKSAAVRGRGVARYNAALQLGDEAAKASAKEAAKRDLVEAAALAKEAAGRIKPTGPWDALWRTEEHERNWLVTLAARAEALRLLASRFDKSYTDEALAAIREYMKSEADGERRLQGHLYTGQMLLDVGRGEEAAAEYEKALADEPDNLDATLGAGLGLFQSGERKRYEEAAAYLRRFVERAPEDHPLRASAEEALDFMSEHGTPPAPRR